MSQTCGCNEEPEVWGYRSADRVKYPIAKANPPASKKEKSKRRKHTGAHEQRQHGQHTMHKMQAGPTKITTSKTSHPTVERDYPRFE